MCRGVTISSSVRETTYMPDIFWHNFGRIIASAKGGLPLSEAINNTQAVCRGNGECDADNMITSCHAIDSPGAPETHG